MTSFQKIIKYGAIAFAIYLCFTIISILVFGITMIFGISTGLEMFEHQQDNESMITKWEQEYTDINDLDVDLHISKLEIKKGETLKVQVSNVSDEFKCTVQGNKLKIQDKKVLKNMFDWMDYKPEVVIYIPEDKQFDEVTLKNGINETYIESIKTNRMTLEMGVGKCQVDFLSAKYAKIEAGAGEATINKANFEELKLDGGVGKFALTSKISQKADISSGVGKMELNLIGLLSDYKIKAETGLGNFVVNNQKVSDNQILGSGDVIIKVDAGVGETIVSFQEKL